MNKPELAGYKHRFPHMEAERLLRVIADCWGSDGAATVYPPNAGDLPRRELRRATER